MFYTCIIFFYIGKSMMRHLASALTISWKSVQKPNITLVLKIRIIILKHTCSLNLIIQLLVKTSTSYKQGI